jgi:hypothetical protein
MFYKNIINLYSNISPILKNINRRSRAIAAQVRARQLGPLQGGVCADRMETEEFTMVSGHEKMVDVASKMVGVQIKWSYHADISSKFFKL